MDLGVGGRAYVITGGTRGLGRATAQALLAEGARVVVSGRSAEGVAAGAAGLGGPDRVVGVAADNSDPATPDRLVAATRDAFGRLDGALISVGGPPGGPVTAVGDDAWRAAFESVFLGAVRLACTLARTLDAGGSLAFVLSSSVRMPIPNLATSNGLRPGLAMVAKTLSDELGPRGIRVNGLLPGRIATDRLTELDAAQGDPAQVRARNETTIPLRRYGEPAEFGRAAAFLLSPAASYLTGVMLPVDGGLLRTL
ncbi:MAG TPA: SDR family oxidoreductase [Mycobacteriales bacterium]|nr:SDR family oxidoreductase [Mycobacteriales bacterium]